MFINWLNLTMTTINIISFVVAAFLFFKNNKTINWGKLIKIQILSFGVWFLEIFLLARNLHDSFSSRALLGIVIQIFSLISFWFTIFYIGKHKLLVAGSEERPLHFFSDGPFKIVRHPFYLTYILSYLGTFISTLNFPYLLLVILLLYFYFKTAREEESLFETSDFIELYTQYRNKTGMFFPKLM